MGLKRKAIEQVTKLLAHQNRRQRVAPPLSGAVKVNIGAGLSVAPGWINVDGSINAWLAAKPRWMRSLGYRLSGARLYYTPEIYDETLSQNRFVLHDINNGLPFADGTVDFVYSSHFVEHLSRTEADALFRDCHRVLKPGGVVRISVPDLEYAWELYRRGEKERMLHDYFFTDSDTEFSHHRYAYDFQLMSNALSASGFAVINKRAAGEGETPDLALLDNRAEYSLFVEATRT